MIEKNDMRSAFNVWCREKGRDPAETQAWRDFHWELEQWSKPTRP